MCFIDNFEGHRIWIFRFRGQKAHSTVGRKHTNGALWGQTHPKFLFPPMLLSPRLTLCLRRRLPRSLFPAIPAQPRTPRRVPPRPRPSLRPFPVLSSPSRPPPPGLLLRRLSLQAASPREKLTWRHTSLCRHLLGSSQDSHPLLGLPLHLEEPEPGAAL